MSVDFLGAGHGSAFGLCSLFNSYIDFILTH